MTITLLEYPDLEAILIEAELMTPEGEWFATIEGYAVFEPDSGRVRDVALLTKDKAGRDSYRTFALNDTWHMKALRDALMTVARSLNTSYRIADQMNVRRRFVADPHAEHRTQWGAP